MFLRIIHITIYQNIIYIMGIYIHYYISAYKICISYLYSIYYIVLTLLLRFFAII